MRFWERRAEEVSGTEGDHRYDVEVFRHNWRGIFLTILSFDTAKVESEDLHIIVNRIAAQKGFNEATVYAYDEGAGLWERYDASMEEAMRCDFVGKLPGFVMERDIHFGGFSMGRRDMIHQIKASEASRGPAYIPGSDARSWFRC